MNKSKDVFFALSVGAMVAGLVLSFSACTQQSPFAPNQNETHEVTLAKADSLNYSTNGNIHQSNKPNRNKQGFIKHAKKKFVFLPEEGVYSGGTLKVLGHGSKFHVKEASLTPPPGRPYGKDVIITMGVKYDADKKELQFRFGPSGCKFAPFAYIKLSYKELGVKQAKLFYIDKDGNYIQQRPDYINMNKRFMIIRVDHFSRYAIAWSR